MLSRHNTGTNHLLDGKKKNATYVASLFDPWIQKLDPQRLCIDCVCFDGASNVQKAGQLLAAQNRWDVEEQRGLGLLLSISKMESVRI
jgi:hypothetical protein